jgi:hypothetical protein
VRRTISLRRSAPLVGVRPLKPLVEGQAARIDARATRAAHGGTLRFRWRVVGAPRGAHVTLRGASTAHPRVVASNPGRYRLALAVAERPRHAAAGHASVAGAGRANPALNSASATGTHAAHTTQSASGGFSCLDPVTPAAATAAAATQPSSPPLLPLRPAGTPVASTPMQLLPAGTQLRTLTPAARPAPVTAGPQPQADPGCTLEIVTADVMPNTAPIGAAFDSNAQQTASNGTVQTGIRIGDDFVQTGTTGAYVTLLDATTLEVLASQRVPSGQLVGVVADELSARYLVQGRDVLMVLTGAPGCCGGDPTVQNANSGFTIVQPFGEPLNTAVHNFGMQLGDGSPGGPGKPGELVGWLQHSISLSGRVVYTYVAPDRVPFATQQNGSAPGTNTMTVGDATYPGALPAGATAGFQVLVTDAALRPQLGTPTVFATNTGNPTQNEQSEAALAALLAHAASTPGATVFMQSIGRPVPASPASAAVANALELLGGNDWIFLSLDGTGGYAFVGGPAAPGEVRSPEDAAEASTKWSSGGELHGLLRRRPDQALRATLADQSPSGNDYELGQIVYQDPTPWPQTDTPGKRAATRYIALQTNMTGDACYTPAQPDFRANYCDVNLDTDVMSDRVAGVDYPSSGATFTRTELHQVKTELESELGMVGEVQTVMTNLSNPLSDARAGDLAQSIAGDVMRSLDVKSESSLSPAVSGDLSVAAGVLYLASDFAGEEAGLGPIASALDLVSEVTTDEGEQEPYWEGLQEAADEMGKQMDDRLQNVIGQLSVYQDILVSDYGKLKAVADKATSTWSWSKTQQTAMADQLNQGIARWLWTAILPAGYDLVSVQGVPAGEAGKVACIFSGDGLNFNFWNPWEHADGRTTFFPLGYWTVRPAAAVMYALLHGSTGSTNSKAVRAGSPLVSAMFGSNGAGLVAPWLLDRAAWTYQSPHMIGQRERNPKKGSCEIEGG